MIWYYTCCCCCCCIASVVSNSVWPHRRQPTTLPRPWDSPGKNTGVGCHFLLQCMKVKSKSKVAQSCRTHSDPMDCSPPSSSIHGIFQARVLEWGAIAFSDFGTKLVNLRPCKLQNLTIFTCSLEEKYVEIMNQKWGFANLKQNRIFQAARGHQIQMERFFSGG